ncbi:MAG: GIY-YIG nuclease family protein [Vulcanimicrobiota bacterium]
MQKCSYVYIITNKKNTVVYTGVTSDLKKRIYEHKNKMIDGFSKRYNLTKLVYFGEFTTIEQAIIYEKKIKKMSRKRKNELINEMNPGWEDLYEGIL